jgi:hypothetical protein
MTFRKHAFCTPVILGRIFVDSHKSPDLAVDVIRTEFRRQNLHISLNDLDLVIFQLSKVSTERATKLMANCE